LVVWTYHYDVPFVSTPENVVRRMLQLCNVKPDELVYDLGAGDGRILFIAAKEFKARAVGIEIRPQLVKQIEDRIIAENLQGRVRVIHGNFFDINISDADVVTLYLLTSVNERLRPKLEKELKPGTRVVSHDFEIPGWRPVKVEVMSDEWSSHRIYLYYR
jgi:predicted RNA methylase